MMDKKSFYRIRGMFIEKIGTGIVCEAPLKISSVDRTKKLFFTGKTDFLLPSETFI